MEQIRIIKEECSGCPMIWDVVLPDGSEGYVKYRWGIIQLHQVSGECGLFRDPLISEQIGDGLDGILPLKNAVKWLKGQGYEVLCEC